MAAARLWVTGARDLGAARGQVVFSLAPFVGVVVAWTFLAEPVIAVQVVATMLLGGGIAFVLRSDHEHEHVLERTEHTHDHQHDVHLRAHRHTSETPDRHGHPLRHEALRHSHPHLPDLHHRHGHD